ncbi:hypothetical protein ACWFMI_15075 [Nocardiopsis terrae]
MQQRSQHLDAASRDTRKLATRYAEARQEFRVAQARAVLRSVGQGSVKDREARVTLAVVDEQFKMDLAEQELKAARDHIGTLRAQLSADQSIGAWLRAEASLPGSTWGA